MILQEIKSLLKVSASIVAATMLVLTWPSQPALAQRPPAAASVSPQTQEAGCRELEPYRTAKAIAAELRSEAGKAWAEESRRNSMQAAADYLDTFSVHRAVVIGNDKYRNIGGFPPLQEAVNDA